MHSENPTSDLESLCRPWQLTENYVLEGLMASALVSLHAWGGKVSFLVVVLAILNIMCTIQSLHFSDGFPQKADLGKEWCIYCLCLFCPCYVCAVAAPSKLGWLFGYSDMHLYFQTRANSLSPL